MSSNKKDQSKNATKHMDSPVEKGGFRKLIDRIVLIAGPMTPLAIAPTAYQVAVDGQTAGINLLTWGTLLFSSVIMSLYALSNKDTALTLTYIPLMLLNAVIVIAVVLN